MDIQYGIYKHANIFEPIICVSANWHTPLVKFIRHTYVANKVAAHFIKYAIVPSHYSC